MLSGKIRSDVDRVWDRVWSSGVSNPLTCVEYISVLLAASRSAEGAVLESALGLGDKPAVIDCLLRVQAETGLGSGDLSDEHSPWLDLDTVRASYEVLRDLQLADRNHDLVGDIFEYVLSKLSTAGRFGQFRTPRHIIQFIIEAVNPKQGETILDPACGTGGFLIAAEEHVARCATQEQSTYIGQELDVTVARLAKSNLFLHNVPNSRIEFGDSLGDGSTKADVVLANPPFAGVVSSERIASYKSGSSRTELLFIEYIMRALRDGGRAGVVVPFGVLTSNNASAIYIRRALVMEHGLQAVVELPPGVFRPYTDVRTALLFWARGNTATDITFARARADGFSLDDRRSEIADNDLPQILKALRHPESLDGRIATTVSASELDPDRFILNPSRYLDSQSELQVATGPSFEEVLATIEDRLGAIDHLVSAIQKDL